MQTQYPIIQAPMAGGATTPELVAAVSNAGGLGTLGAGYMSAEDIKKTIHRIRELTTKPFGVNLFIPVKHHATEQHIEMMCHIIERCSEELEFKIQPKTAPYLPSFEEQMQVVIDEKVPVFSSTFGVLDAAWVTQLKKNGTIVMGTATNIEEALLQEKSGVDYIIAQGGEAGGHRGTFIGKDELSLDSIMHLISLFKLQIKIPVIAAGGIMTAADIEAVMALGADGVQMGTVFLTCIESGANPAYKKALLNSGKNDTTLTRAFSGKLARGLNNAFIERMKPHEAAILDYPIQNALTQPMRREAVKQSNTDFMSMWAGTHAYACKPCLVSELMNEFVGIFKDFIELINKIKTMKYS